MADELPSLVPPDSSSSSRPDPPSYDTSNMMDGISKKFDGITKDASMTSFLISIVIIILIVVFLYMTYSSYSSGSTGTAVLYLGLGILSGAVFYFLASSYARQHNSKVIEAAIRLLTTFRSQSAPTVEVK